ncbi:MAG TPA: hypothetical protein DIW24_05670 [Bacteroidetes bacterium]|nr:hypothetical protein [Bacteroidota bacterium]
MYGKIVTNHLFKGFIPIRKEKQRTLGHEYGIHARFWHYIYDSETKKGSYSKMLPCNLGDTLQSFGIRLSYKRTITAVDDKTK